MTAQTASQATERVADARFFRVLGDPTRLAIIEELLTGPRTVGELVERIGGPQSRISNHLACLRWCRFVEFERDGRQIRYRITDPRLRELLDITRELVGDTAEHLASCNRIGP
jgi:ArsR family transcriptional regulator, cadmium/lead-responsive transcriptional repressor